MTVSQRHASARILPLHRPDGLHALLAEIMSAADQRQRDRGGLPVTATLDVDAGLDVPGDARQVRGILTPLVEAAFAASAGRGRRRPGGREVVVTALAQGDRVEIEVADSGDDIEAEVADEIRTLAELAGATLVAARCPEGGMAVTLHVLRRRANSRAA